MSIQIHMVALGLGDKKHLTFGAEERLHLADHVYVMTNPKSWMFHFVESIIGSAEKIRTYMPTNVVWNSGWQTESIFLDIVQEVENLVSEGKDVVFAMAGDVSIFSNIADTIVPLLKERHLKWDVYPGVSFLNALPIETLEPLVGEADSLAVTFLTQASKLDVVFKTANVVVLYNPAGVNGLQDYIQAKNLAYAKMVLFGVQENKIIDLTLEKIETIRGLVILRRPPSFSLSHSYNYDQLKPNELPFHLGLNGWDSQNNFFAVNYPDSLWWSPSGNPHKLEKRFQFSNNPTDIRGFFIDSHDNLFVSLKGFSGDSYGCTFVSRDQGQTFQKAFEQCFWGMDEDKSDHLFAGIYHEKGELGGSCSILWSMDNGTTWIDIASADWKQQLHVHHLAISPTTGWLYATLGDKLGLRGCWRSKIYTARLAIPCKIGSYELHLTCDSSTLELSKGDKLLSSSGVHMEVVEAIDSVVKLAQPLSKSLDITCQLIKLDWQLKIADQENSLQFIGIAFKDNYIYLSNDTNLKCDPEKNVVFRAQDDGTDRVVPPISVLKASPTQGWGAFFLECDTQGRLWTGVRPVTGHGAIWFSDDGSNWYQFMDSLQEDLPCWRGTHTFRDATLGQTGDGRNLSGSKGYMIFSYLNHAISTIKTDNNQQSSHDAIVSQPEDKYNLARSKDHTALNTIETDSNQQSSLPPLALQEKTDKQLENTPYWTPPTTPWKPIKKQLNSNLQIAAIVSDELFQGLRFEGNIFLLTPDNWKAVLQLIKPDFLLVESTWFTATGHWYMAQSTEGNEQNILKTLISYAKAQNISTVYWFTCDHSYHEHFFEFSRLFEYVFCADTLEVEQLNREGIKAHLLLPAIQPAIYNPLRNYEEHNFFDLGILYDGWVDCLQLKNADLNILQQINQKGYRLSIIESKDLLTPSQKQRTHHAIQNNILGCVTKPNLPVIIKHSQIYISLSPTQKTATNHTWSMLAAAACQVPVVFRGEFLVDNVAIGCTLQRPNDDEFLAEVKKLSSNTIYREHYAHQAWRYAFHKNTFANRIQTICTTLGITHDWEEYPKVSIITPSIRPTLLAKCIQQFEKQTYPNKELIVVFNGLVSHIEQEQKLFENKQDITLLTVAGDYNAGTLLNLGIHKANGHMCFRMDDDDYYGENYILDAMLYLRAIDADVIGKTFAYMNLEAKGLFYERNNVTIPPCFFTGSKLGAPNIHFAGCSIAGKKDFLTKIRYPDNNYASADTSLRDSINEYAPDAICLNQDTMNLVADRRTDTSQHTWRISQNKLLKRMVQSPYQITDIFAPSMHAPFKQTGNKLASTPRKKAVFLGPLGFKEGIWDTRAHYIFPDLFEELFEHIEINMIVGSIPDHAYPGFQHLVDTYKVNVFELPQVSGNSIHYKILEKAWGIVEIIRPDIIFNGFGATIFGYPGGVLSHHYNCRMVLRAAGDEIGSRIHLGHYQENSAKHVDDLKVEKQGFDLADTILAISPWEQARIRNACEQPNKVKVCMRGVDLQRFSPQAKPQGQHSKKFKILFVGRQSLEKGYDIVEAVADKALARNPNIEFQFAGTFDQSIDANKNYLGFVESKDLPTLYNSVDAFILVSRTEGFPQALAEAMACGKPCIISKHLFQGFIKDREEALLVDLEMDEILKNVLLLAENKDLFKKLSVNARTFAQEQLDKNIWRKIYRNIILDTNNFDEFEHLSLFTP